MAFRALRHRNFRLFFVGQGLSLVGTWMQSVAMSWLVYRLTGSALLLGVVGFAAQIPGFLLAPVAGVLADHWSRHRIVMVTQVLSMIQASLLAALVLSGNIEVWHIIALAGLLGLVNGFDIPARQSLLVELVEGPGASLANAIALNSSMFNAARLIGPAIAGLMIGLVGEGAVFLVNAVSYVAVIAALSAIQVKPRRVRIGPPDILRNIHEGLGYALGSPAIRNILILLAAVNLVGSPYVVLMPVFATEVLHGGPHTLGFLMSATGLGALGGALFLAARPTVRGLGRVITACSIGFGAGLVLFSQSRTELLSIATLLVVSFALMAQVGSSNTILQTIVDDDKRGRVMSLYTMAFMGMAPFGSLIAGTLGSRIGAGNTVLLGGIVSIGAGLIFARRLPELRAAIRPIYVRLGIIPEVAAGLQPAPDLRPPG